MNTDPIVAEVRQARDMLAGKLCYDLEAIVRDARRRQKQSGRKVVSLKPRKPADRPSASVSKS
jgi:hypothetical protein